MQEHCVKRESQFSWKKKSVMQKVAFDVKDATKDKTNERNVVTSDNDAKECGETVAAPQPFLLLTDNHNVNVDNNHPAIDRKSDTLGKNCYITKE